DSSARLVVRRWRIGRPRYHDAAAHARIDDHRALPNHRPLRNSQPPEDVHLPAYVAGRGAAMCASDCESSRKRCVPSFAVGGRGRSADAVLRERRQGARWIGWVWGAGGGGWGWGPGGAGWV